MAIDDTIKHLQADPAVVQQKLRDTEGNVNTQSNLSDLLTTGRVGSVMVNDADKSGIESRLSAKGVAVYGNRKVPRGMAAVYDKAQKMIGLYRLAA